MEAQDHLNIVKVDATEDYLLIYSDGKLLHSIPWSIIRHLHYGESGNTNISPLVKAAIAISMDAHVRQSNKLVRPKYITIELKEEVDGMMTMKYETSILLGKWRLIETMYNNA